MYHLQKTAGVYFFLEKIRLKIEKRNSKYICNDFEEI